jgi:integrase/recombinase XerD
MQIDGSGRVHLVQSMPVLRPDEQVLKMMLDGWRNQQLSRNLQFATIDQRLRHVLVAGSKIEEGRVAVG